MAELYLLPCECGQTLRVGRAQAGQAVVCSCGKTVRVPTLRGLRDLAPAPAETTGPSPRRWTRLHGAMFAGGLMIAVVAAALALLQLRNYSIASHFTQDQSSDLLAYEAVHIDDHPPAELFDLWNMIQAQGLGIRVTPPWVEAQRTADRYRRNATISGIVALLGAFVACGALFIGRSEMK
jgi:hypothetical protein